MAIPRRDAAHLLRRAGFGGTPAEIDALAGQSSWSAAVDSVLDRSGDPPLNPPPIMSDPAAGDYSRWVGGVQWWIERMRTSPTPIVERLALFWHNHFVSGTDKVPMPLLWDQLQLFRSAGMGDFHTLAQQMAVQPAMLLYLDNASNVAGAENENFAREVMELFLLGNFTFTEADVIAMARAWTGHGLNRSEDAYEWHPTKHDSGTKSLFGIDRDWNGPDTITEIVRGSKASVSARFIAAKLWSYLAYPNPEPALVADLASAYLAADLDLTTLLRAIFNRPEFLAPATRTALVRSPVEWTVALLKALDIRAADAHPEWFLENMGQRLFEPPNVAGWKQNGYWVSTSATWGRADFASYLRWVATSNDGPYRRFGGLDTKTPDEIVAVALSTFGLDEPSPVTREVIRSWAAGLKGNWDVQWSVRPNIIPLTALSPDFQLA